jgi:ribokinase
LPVRGETVFGDSCERFPGGKGANQAVAAALADASTVMVGAVGNDADGEFMRTVLAKYGIDQAGVETVPAPTHLAVITVASDGNQIVVVPGADRHIDAGRVASLHFDKGDVCVAQGETTAEVVRNCLSAARGQGAATLFNPAPATDEARELIPLADVIVVNEVECAFFAGVPLDPESAERLPDAAKRALELRPDQTLIMTLGERGVIASLDDKSVHYPGRAVDAIDSTGAGDCFVGTLAAAMARGSAVAEGIGEANAAAALSVGKKGALISFPKRRQVLELLRR